MSLTSEQISADERRSGWRTIRKVGPYLWPDGQPWVKRRVVLSLIVLVVAKLVTVYTPVLYKGAVDALANEGVPMLALGAVGLTVAYGMARLMTGEALQGAFTAQRRADQQVAGLERLEAIQRLGPVRDAEVWRIGYQCDAV